jgi:hypothetical protein
MSIYENTDFLFMEVSDVILMLKPISMRIKKNTFN